MCAKTVYYDLGCQSQKHFYSDSRRSLVRWYLDIHTHSIWLHLAEDIFHTQEGRFGKPCHTFIALRSRAGRSWLSLCLTFLGQQRQEEVYPVNYRLNFTPANKFSPIGLPGALGYKPCEPFMMGSFLWFSCAYTGARESWERRLVWRIIFLWTKDERWWANKVPDHSCWGYGYLYEASCKLMEDSRGLAGKGMNGYKWLDGFPYRDSTHTKTCEATSAKEIPWQVRVYRVFKNIPQEWAVDCMEGGRQQSIPAKSARWSVDHRSTQQQFILMSGRRNLRLSHTCYISEKGLTMRICLICSLQDELLQPAYMG